MALESEQLVRILEASLLVAGRPLNMGQIDNLFEHEAKRDRPDRDAIRAALDVLREKYADSGVELVEVASGFRIQARQEYAPFVANLFQEKAPRYSRALLETLVLIAYRQPITRGEVEDVRGVAVSTNIIKTLLEREWIRVLGHRDVPGKPAIYGTTRQFLDYFNLKRIDELPTLSEIKELEQIDPDLAREMALLESNEAAEAAAETETGDEAGDETSDDEVELNGQPSAAETDADQIEASNPTDNSDVESDDAALVTDHSEESTEAEMTSSSDQTLVEGLSTIDATGAVVDTLDVDLGDDAQTADSLSASNQPLPAHSLADTVH